MQKINSRNSVKIISFTLLFLCIVGCGFHLKGTFSIPDFLKILRISPNQPTDPFQRALRQSLKSNGVRLVDEQDPERASAATLNILSQAFAERTVGYGSDGQTNRSTVQLTINYQITNAQGKVVISNTVRVERMLTVNPNAVLGTEFERARLNNELYMDATNQLMRQLSVTSVKHEGPI